MSGLKPLILLNILCSSAMMAFLAVVGPVIRKLNLQEWHAGLMVALAGIAWVLLSRYWGKKSDSIGRKKILLISMFGFFLSYLLLASFINYAIITPIPILISLSVLILARVMIGTFYSAIPPVLNALIADRIESSKRTSAMASLGAASGLGMILGPVMGALLSTYGLAVPLYASAFLPFIAILIIYFLLDNDIKIKKTLDISLKIFDKRIRFPMLASFATMYCIVTSQICLGFYILDKFNMSNIETAKLTGYILAIIGITFILTQFIVSKISSIQDNTWLFLGSILTATGYFIVSIITTKIELTIGFCIGVIGLGMVMPAYLSLTANNVEAHEQGVAAGTVSAAQGVAIIISPIFSTLLYEINNSYPFVFAGFIFVILTIVSFLNIKHKTI